MSEKGELDDRDARFLGMLKIFLEEHNVPIGAKEVPHARDVELIGTGEMRTLITQMARSLQDLTRDVAEMKPSVAQLTVSQNDMRASQRSFESDVKTSLKQIDIAHADISKRIGELETTDKVRREYTKNTGDSVRTWVAIIVAIVSAVLTGGGVIWAIASGVVFKHP